MALTFGELKKVVAPYVGRAGKSPSSDDTATFARQVMQLLLISGSDVAIKKLGFLAYRGCISMPPEVEVPIKARVNNQSAHLWTKWFSFHNASESFEKCPPAHEVMMEDGSTSPLIYDLPDTGAQVGLQAMHPGDDGKEVILQGPDTAGKQVFTFHKGEQVPGEKITLCYNKLVYSHTVFGDITGAVKPPTDGYVTAHIVDPLANYTQFIADWSPNETRPSYRRFKLIRRCAEIVHVSVLCRVRLRDTYHENELTLFDDYTSIILAAQRLQSEVGNDIATANYKRQAVEDVLDKAAGYRKISGSPVEVFFPLSGGSVRNIIR